MPTRTYSTYPMFIFTYYPIQTAASLKSHTKNFPQTTPPLPPISLFSVLIMVSSFLICFYSQLALSHLHFLYYLRNTRPQDQLFREFLLLSSVSFSPHFLPVFLYNPLILIPTFSHLKIYKLSYLKINAYYHLSILIALNVCSSLISYFLHYTMII